MISITNLYSISYIFGSQILSWELLNLLNENLDDYVLNIYRGETPQYSQDDYSLIYSGLSADNYTYIDIMTELEYNSWRELYYTIQPLQLSTQTIGVMTDSVSQISSPDYIAIEMIYQHSLALQTGYGGQPLKILKRKTFGTFCTNCFDITLGRSNFDFCETCYDTHFIGGYYTPIQIQGMINAAPKRSQVLIWGEWQPADDVILTISYYPLLSPGDVIVDKRNRRWKVVQVRPTQKNLYTISQDAQIRLVSKDDVIYKFAIGNFN